MEKPSINGWWLSDWGVALWLRTPPDDLPVGFPIYWPIPHSKLPFWVPYGTIGKAVIVLVYLNDTIGISTNNITYIWNSWPSIKWYRKSDHRIKPSWPLYLTYILYRLNSWPLDRLNGTYITIVFISHEQIAHNWVCHIFRHIHISTLIYYLWDMYYIYFSIYCLNIFSIWYINWDISTYLHIILVHM